MRDLAPEIYRQRAVIEGCPVKPIGAKDLKKYLSGLSDVLEMVKLTSPVAHRSEKYGEAGWIHWESSGAHFYAWEQPQLFFSVDIYTCKQFDIKDAIDYTKLFFGIEHLEYKEF